MIFNLDTIFFDSKVWSKSKENIWKIVKLRNLYLHTTWKIPENFREIEKFPGNEREMNFPGISREFPGGNSRETALDLTMTSSKMSEGLCIIHVNAWI